MKKAAWILAALSLIISACAPAAQLKGTDLGQAPAPDFQLVDQAGQVVSLSDLRGRVVVLTFLYTHCQDECPLIASKLHAADRQLGQLMNKIAFVAVSVDPEHDTPQAIRAFIHTHQLDGQLQYLVGTRAQLAPVWSAYYVAAQVVTDEASSSSVSHSTRVLVIDQAGNERVNFDSSFDPADLVFDLQTLANHQG